MQEIWKSIRGYEGFYEVSSLGRVKSLGRKGSGYSLEDRILKPSLKRHGYLSVVLCVKQEREYRSIHRLVAEAFLERKEGQNQVNHINGDKADNTVENLEWCTASENDYHAYRTGLKTAKGECNGQAKLTWDKVAFIRKNYKPYDPVHGVMALARRFQVSPSVISSIVNNKTWREDDNNNNKTTK